MYKAKRAKISRKCTRVDLRLRDFEPIEDENDEKIIDLDQDISDTMPIFSLKSYLNPSIPLRK